MQCSPQELKETLLKHLDNEFNVVDMQGVLHVISVLEKYPITKENLEQTRLGKYVNDMRRKTENRELARRAKDLVRKWQQLVSLSSGETTRSSVSVEQSKRYQASVGPTNGVQVTPIIARSENGLCSKVSSPADSVSSAQSSLAPANRSRRLPPNIRSGSQPTTPVTVGLQTVSSVTSPSLATVPSASVPNIRASSLLVRSSDRCTTAPVDHSAKFRPVSTSIPVSNGTEKVEESHRFGSESSTKAKQKHVTVANGTVSPNRTFSSCNGTWSVRQHKEPNGRTPVMAVEPVVSESVQPLPVLKIKINRTSASGSVNSPVAETVAACASRKTPKIETTAQLIKKLHANGELNLVASETIERIAKNQIRHEVDDTPQSVVPEGAKPRPHKRRKVDMTASIVTEPPRMTDADLLQVKAERVRNFVQMTCDAAAPPVDNDLLSILGSEPSVVLPTFGSSGPTVPVCPPGTTDLSLPKRGITAPACLPELPVIEESSIDWTSTDYVVPDTRPAPTALDVDRLHFSNWEGVNGQWDYRGEWSDWTQSYSARTHSDDLLHILPYIDLTD